MFGLMVQRVVHFRAWILAAVLVAFVCAGWLGGSAELSGGAIAQVNEGADQDSQLAVTEATILTKSGRKYKFQLELASTRFARVRGLMYRKSLASNEGMILVYNKPRHAGVWMKNTLIPLDLLFVDRVGKIIKIVQRATPLSEQVHQARNPIKAIVEVLGGTAERLAIQVGDTVEHEIFKS